MSGQGRSDRQPEPLDPWLATPADPVAGVPSAPAPPSPSAADDIQDAGTDRLAVPATVKWTIGLWAVIEVILITLLIAMVQAPLTTIRWLRFELNSVFALSQAELIEAVRTLAAVWMVLGGIGWGICAVGLWKGQAWARIVSIALAAAVAATALTVWPAGAVIVVCAIVAIVLSLSAPVSAFVRAVRARRSLY